MDTPVIVRVATELRPYEQDPNFRAWETPPGSVPWLEALVSAEKRMQGYQGQGLPISSIKSAFDQTMIAKDSNFKPVSEQSCSRQIKLLEEYGFIAKIGPRWASTPSGRSAINLMGQRGSLWGVLKTLLESGKVSKDDVLEAMIAGYKKGSEMELLDVVSKPSTGA